MKKLMMVLAVFGTFVVQAYRIGTTCYEYWDWGDDFGLLDNAGYFCFRGEQFGRYGDAMAIPVQLQKGESLTASDIVLVYGSLKSTDVAGVQVVDDETMRTRVYLPLYNAIKEGCDFDEWTCGMWGLGKAIGGESLTGADYECDADLWPNGAAADPLRMWILVRPVEESLKSGRGCLSFVVGIRGTSVYSDPFFFYKAMESEVGCPVTPQMIFGSNISFSGWNDFELNNWGLYDGLVFDGEDFWPDARYEFEYDPNDDDESEIVLKVNVPSAGSLVISGPGMDTVAGNDNVDGNWLLAAKVDSEAQATYGVNARSPFPNQGGHFRVLNVSSKRTVELRAGQMNDDRSELPDIFNIAFYPAGGKGAAVVPSFSSVQDDIFHPTESVYTWSGTAYLQGYVTGGGYYEKDSTVLLKAVPLPGEAFDHWEFYGFDPLANGLTASQLKSPTLSFKLVEGLIDPVNYPELHIRAVWKAKQTVIAVPVPLGSASVTGNGAYFGNYCKS